MKNYIILVRHGESRWNKANKFTGWVDVPLSDRGIKEAMLSAKKLHNISFDVAFTSTLRRAQETLNLILAEQKYTGIYLHKTDWRSTWFLRYNNKAFEEHEIPIHISAKLNERYYGKLQGINKDDARKHFGAEKVHMWRRSYAVAPPGGESLKQVYKRAVPYFKSTIMKHVKAHQNVLVAAHGNSLRAIIKWIENISDEEIPNLELATGKPIIYEYENGKLKLLKHKHSFDRPVPAGAPKKKKTTTKKKTTAKKKPVTKRKPVKKKVVTRKKTVKRKPANTKRSVKKKTVARRKAPARTKRGTSKKATKKRRRR